MNIKFDSIGEIMGMSGPWSANVIVNNTQLEGQFIEQKPVLNEERTMLFLVRIIEYKHLFIKKIHFGIYAYSLIDQSRYLSKEKFPYLFIDQINRNDIIYFEAFHNQDLSKKRDMAFSAVNFEKTS